MGFKSTLSYFRSIAICHQGGSLLAQGGVDPGGAGTFWTPVAPALLSLRRNRSTNT